MIWYSLDIWNIYFRITGMSLGAGTEQDKGVIEGLLALEILRRRLHSYCTAYCVIDASDT